MRTGICLVTIVAACAAVPFAAAEEVSRRLLEAPHAVSDSHRKQWEQMTDVALQDFVAEEAIGTSLPEGRNQLPNIRLDFGGNDFDGSLNYVASF